MKHISFTSMLLSFGMLSACSNSFVEEGIKSTETAKEEKKSEEKKLVQLEKQEKEELRALYKELEKPLDQVIVESDLDEVQLLDLKFQVKENYTDSREFAAFVSNTIYQFTTNRLTPKDYYLFLKHYGSEEYINNMPKDEANAINILEQIQVQKTALNISYTSYEVSDVIFEVKKDEGIFYRKVAGSQGFEYYLTSIVRENNDWKFHSDDISPPFESIEKVEKRENN